MSENISSKSLDGDDEKTVDAEHVLALAASNPDACPEILEALATSDSPYVRSKVAENENTPATVLDTFMHDCTRVRAALAHNPKAIERVWLLANDSNPAVRLTLADNPNLPDHVYQVLEKDPNRQVARRARRTLGKMRQVDNPVINLFRLLTKAS